MFNYNDEYDEIQKLCKASLNKENKKPTKTLLSEMQTYIKNKDNLEDFFEEYDPTIYESKAKIDMLYYNQLLEKLEEGDISSIEKVITELYKNVNQIYHHINIKPETYGNILKLEDLNESIEMVHKKVSEQIFEFLDINFYRLSNDKRKERYFTESIDLSKKLIIEGVEPDDAISYSVKVVMMENFLRNIAFPRNIWTRIQFLSEDVDYGELFDQTDLVNLVESFNKKLTAVSKIVATCI